MTKKKKVKVKEIEFELEDNEAAKILVIQELIQAINLLRIANGR